MEWRTSSSSCSSMTLHCRRYGVSFAGLRIRVSLCLTPSTLSQSSSSLSGSQGGADGPLLCPGSSADTHSGEEGEAFFLLLLLLLMTSSLFRRCHGYAERSLSILMTSSLFRRCHGYAERLLSILMRVRCHYTSVHQIGFFCGGQPRSFFSSLITLDTVTRLQTSGGEKTPLVYIRLVNLFLINIRHTAYVFALHPGSRVFIYHVETARPVALISTLRRFE